MVEQASRVVDTVVDMANTAFIVPTSSLPRAESFLVMPPPASRAAHPTGNEEVEVLSAPPQSLGGGWSEREVLRGLQLLSRAAARLPIVSPDVSSAPAGADAARAVPHLALVVSDDDEPNGSAADGLGGGGTGGGGMVVHDLSDLSPDQCADIVDGALEDVGDFVLVSPSKKRKALA
jgi:hypothetical protein